MLIRYYLRYDGVNTGDCCCYELYFLNFDFLFPDDQISAKFVLPK